MVRKLIAKKALFFALIATSSISMFACGPNFFMPEEARDYSEEMLEEEYNGENQSPWGYAYCAYNEENQEISELKKKLEKAKEMALKVKKALNNKKTQ